MMNPHRALSWSLLTALLAGCGANAEMDVSALRAGPMEGGTVQTGTCGELMSDCEARCEGDFENTTCTGVLRGGRFDDVEVPEGESCQLEGTLVRGNLIVGRNASAEVGGGTFVCGNVQAEEARELSAGGLRVCGNLQASKTTRTHLREGVEVRQNFDASEVDRVTLVATLVCADAQLSKIESLEVRAGSASVVAKACSADEIESFDFTGLTVVGDNDACVGTR